jgi:hypothetical protein
MTTKLFGFNLRDIAADNRLDEQGNRGDLLANPLGGDVVGRVLFVETHSLIIDM